MLERPKLRGTTAAFALRLFGKHVTKTNALETLVIAAFVRGLSVRDVEATLAEALGDQAAIPKSTVSEVCKAIRAEYQAWARRGLDEIMLDYLFLDASFFRMHPGSPAEPVVAAWGITTEGKPVFVGLSPGTGESTDAWAEFLTGLRECGLGTPLLVVSDGAKGLIAALNKSTQKRCARDVLSIGSVTCSPRFPPGCKPRSATDTGRFSIPPTWASNPDPSWSRSWTSGLRRSPPNTATSTWRLCGSCSPTTQG